MRISVVADAKQARIALDRMQKQQKFAIASAVTAIAKQVVVDLKAEMAKDFDRPTTYALNAFTIRPAKKDFPTAYVVSKTGRGRNRAAWTFLRWEASGGQRVAKGFELKLAAVSGGQYVVPTKLTPLDGNGNIQRRWLEEVLTGVAAATNAKASARLARQRRKGGQQAQGGVADSPYFVAHVGGVPTGRARGIWQLMGKGEARAVLLFQSNPPTYKVKFKVDETIRRSVQQHRTALFQRAIANAIATARKP